MTVTEVLTTTKTATIHGKGGMEVKSAKIVLLRCNYAFEAKTVGQGMGGAKDRGRALHKNGG
jgi:hypothetical protein